MEGISARVIPLEGVLNARELGGLPLRNGRCVRKGCLIRAGRLSDLTARDRAVLSGTWGVRHIVDLRDRQEIREHPDQVLEGAALHHLSIFPEGKEGITREDHGEELIDRAIRRAEGFRGGGARRLLQEIYPDMVLNQFCVSKLREFFQLLRRQDGTLIWHCTSGKDRTGLTCALLLWVLGASWHTILEDYLLTNRQTEAYRENLCTRMRERGADPEAVQEMRVLESVDPSYLTSCKSAIAKTYGSIDRFLEEYLDLTPEAQKQLRAKYTVAQID